MRLMSFRTFSLLRPVCFCVLTNLKDARMPPLGVFLSEIFCVFYSSYSVYSSYISIKNGNHCYAMAPPFHIDRCAITMPWARRFI